MLTLVPILRIFDCDKAIQFYVDWLGFTLDWAQRPPEAPAYLQVSLRGITLNLSEHHGDCCPGAQIRVLDFLNLTEYHRQLRAQNYRYNRPSLQAPPWAAHTLEMQVTDPFGNRLTFSESPNIEAA